MFKAQPTVKVPEMAREIVPGNTPTPGNGLPVRTADSVHASWGQNGQAGDGVFMPPGVEREG
jgi:hypothetical protein